MARVGVELASVVDRIQIRSLEKPTQGFRSGGELCVRGRLGEQRGSHDPGRKKGYRHEADDRPDRARLTFHAAATPARRERSRRAAARSASPNEGEFGSYRARS